MLRQRNALALDIADSSVVQEELARLEVELQEAIEDYASFVAIEQDSSLEDWDEMKLPRKRALMKAVGLHIVVIPGPTGMSATEEERRRRVKITLRKKRV